MTSRYSNTGLHRAEQLFEGAHPHAGQYLDQAPVLVMWALPWVSTGDESAQTFARLWVQAKCESGPALKVMLRDSGFSAPMRQISAKAIRPSHGSLYRALARVDGAVLGQSIPAKVNAQRLWLIALDGWLSQWKHKAFVTHRLDELFTWGVRRFAGCAAKSLAADLADFQASPTAPPFNTAWGLARAKEEMDGWHARITLESQLRGLPVRPDDAIDLGRYPDVVEVGFDLTFTALRTPRQLADEGTAMRHCVATYIRSVFDGKSHIVSITKAGKRLATLEFAGPEGRRVARQLKGPRNSAVAPMLLTATNVYLAKLHTASQGKAA